MSLHIYIYIYISYMYRAHTHGLIDPLQREYTVLQGFALALGAWRGVSSILCVPPWYRWRAAGHVVDWRQRGEIWDQCWGPQLEGLVGGTCWKHRRNPASPESIPTDFGQNQRSRGLKPFTDLWTEWTLKQQVHTSTRYAVFLPPNCLRIRLSWTPASNKKLSGRRVMRRLTGGSGVAIISWQPCYRCGGFHKWGYPKMDGL